MRLWHKDLIPYLPRQQLLAQWRELCAIAGSIAKKGTPNHLLVNKVLKYDIRCFINYSGIVIGEIKSRGYKINKNSYERFLQNIKARMYNWTSPFDIGKELYHGWHNDRYLRQCLFNLQEKYDCGGIPEEEWKIIEYHFGGVLEGHC